MGNHPNRSRAGGAARNPTAAEIVAARTTAGLTQASAGLMLHVNVQTWQQWEYGARRMHPAFWELFLIKTSPLDQHPAP